MGLQKSIQVLLPTIARIRMECYYSIKAARRPQPVANVVDMGKSLAAKGFLRPHKPYTAPADAADKVRGICASVQISAKNEYKLESLPAKFKFLEACFAQFKHCVPNSQVHEIQTVGDVIKFYETSVDTTVPFDKLVNADLPENLHIQKDYVRFHPDTDSMFNGQTAFPKSSTLVTGLKYRDKYEGHKAKRSWP